MRLIFFILTALALNLPLAYGQEAPAKTRDSNGQTYRFIDANHFEMGAGPWGDFRVDHVNRPTQDDVPTFPVIISQPFYMATTEVTVGQFRKFVEATDYSVKTPKGIVGWKPVDDERGAPKASFDASESFSWKNPGFPQEDSQPVVGISYYDAKAYCEWLSKEGDAKYRLPTEAEWECACRAGTRTNFSFGNEYRDSFHKHANLADVALEKEAPGRTTHQWLIDLKSSASDDYAFTAPVGSYEPNSWGLHDMHGNVWEWCEDRYLDTWYQEFKQTSHGTVRKRAIDPLCTEKWNEHGQWQVIRSGSWYLAPLQCRSSSRGVFNATDAACYLGFRVVREVTPDIARRYAAEHERSEAALAALIESAKEAREFDDQTIRLAFSCEQLSDGLFKQLTGLNYEIDVSIRPPGAITSETIAKFADVKHLSGFALATNCSDISDETFSMLSKHTRIRRLQITGSGNLANEHLFQHLGKSDQLTELNFQGDGITDEGLLQLPALKHLKTLYLNSTKSEGESLKRFVGSPLDQVAIYNMTDDAAKQLELFPGVRHVNASNSPLSKRGLESITKLPKIYALTLVNCSELSDDDLALVGNLPALQQLSLQETAAGDVTIRSLAESLTLRQLRLGSKNLTDRGASDLCRIVPLQELTLTDDTTSITDESFRDFWKLRNLRTLSLSAPKISGATFSTLAELPGLRRVSIHSASLTDEACKHLARIESLSELMIGDWQNGGPAALSDAGILELANSPNLKKLTIIRKGTAITDQGVERLKKEMDGVQIEFP